MLIKETLSLFNQTEEAPKIICNLMPSSPFIYTQKSSFQSVIHALVSNGFDAIKGRVSGKICINSILCPKNPDLIMIEVQDNGRGIDPSALNKVFEPFFSTKSLLERGGLGLSFAKKTIESHGGKISIRSCSEGTTVSIEFPIIRENEPNTQSSINENQCAVFCINKSQYLFVKTTVEKLGFSCEWTQDIEMSSFVSLFFHEPPLFDPLPMIYKNRQMTPQSICILCSNQTELLNTNELSPGFIDAILPKDFSEEDLQRTLFFCLQRKQKTSE